MDCERFLAKKCLLLDANQLIVCEHNQFVHEHTEKSALRFSVGKGLLHEVCQLHKLSD